MSRDSLARARCCPTAGEARERAGPAEDEAATRATGRAAAALLPVSRRTRMRCCARFESISEWLDGREQERERENQLAVPSFGSGGDNPQPRSSLRREGEQGSQRVQVVQWAVTYHWSLVDRFIQAPLPPFAPFRVHVRAVPAGSLHEGLHEHRRTCSIGQTCLVPSALAYGLQGKRKRSLKLFGRRRGKLGGLAGFLSELVPMDCAR